VTRNYFPNQARQQELSKRGLLHNISFSLRRGEIVGLAGLVGAGRTDLARAIFGDITIDSGQILVAGETVAARHSPRRAISTGVALVSEDRKEQGLVLGLSVRKNISLAALPALSRMGFIGASQEKRLARSYVEQLTIKTPSIEQKTLYLSGGNQQRVVIGKWLATQPKVLIVDEPTRGIDVGAKASIHSLLCDLAKQGVAILMISSDLPEILAMSDRILVMRRGRITAELSAQVATQSSWVREYEQDAGFGEPPSSNVCINDFRNSDGLSNISRLIPFHLVDRNLVVGRVIKFCDPGRFMGGRLLGMLEAPTDLEVDSNTGRTPGVAVDQRQEPRVSGSFTDSCPGIMPVQRALG
jgi:ABC-type multidrug transport system ATPase subunit